MIFVVNGVIRSLTITEREHELKMLLLGKRVKINNDESLTVHDILLSNHRVVFCDKVEHFEIIKVKKIEIDYQLKRIKISTNNTHYIIPIS